MIPIPSHEQAFWILCGALTVFALLFAWFVVLLSREARELYREFLTWSLNRYLSREYARSRQREAKRLSPGDRQRMFGGNQR
jgi:hypothetical protein